MISIQGLNQLAPELTYMDLLAPAHQSGHGPKVRPLKLDGPMQAPKMIRQSDMRPHTMKVKGKSNPDSIIMSKNPGVPCTDSMMPHFGRFRNEPKGLYYGADPAVNIDCQVMDRPDSAFGFLQTKLKQP